MASTLPPVSEARSTTTDPGFIASTIARVTSRGARLVTGGTIDGYTRLTRPEGR